jgi:Ni,Fe-hydrogenase I large subunit
MVNADVAVALVQAGLATLSSSASGTPIVSGPADLPASAATTVTVYTDSDTVITGAIADWVVLLKAGFSTMDRLRARALESLYLIQQILGTYSKTGTWSGGAFTGSWGGGWIDELIALPTGSSTWKNKTIPAGTFQGWGGTEAPRGALMHQCTITDGLITKYQCIVPTTWNGSPTDGTNHGAIEQAVIGAPFSAAGATFVSQGGGSVHTAGGVEVLRIAQSFDPCIACAVH